MELPGQLFPDFLSLNMQNLEKRLLHIICFQRITVLRPEDRMTLGRVFDLGQITNKIVELDNKSLNMQTFINGSTGYGKSNTVYQMLSELHQDRIPFLVIEPAKENIKMYSATGRM